MTISSAFLNVLENRKASIESTRDEHCHVHGCCTCLLCTATSYFLQLFDIHFSTCSRHTPVTVLYAVHLVDDIYPCIQHYHCEGVVPRGSAVELRSPPPTIPREPSHHVSPVVLRHSIVSICALFELFTSSISLKTDDLRLYFRGLALGLSEPGVPVVNCNSDNWPTTYI